MAAPNPCLHCELHDAIQRWIDKHGHPGAVEIVRCLAIVEWDVRQAADWIEDGEPVPVDGLETRH